MDINQLLHRHQVSLMCVTAATSIEARHSHKGMARLYADRIDALRPHADLPMQVAVDNRALCPAA